MHANLLLAMLLTTATAHHDGTPFTRTYKQGESETYVANVATEVFGSHTLSIDIGLTTGKVDANGKTSVAVHMSNKQTTGSGTDSTMVAANATVLIGAHNLPVSYPIAQGDTSLFGLMLFLAGSTIDKPVTVGQEEPLSWANGPITFNGTIKVLSIQPEKKSLIAQIKVKLGMGGQDAGVLTMVSSYDSTDFELVQSDGTIEFGDLKEQLKFSRKPSK